MTASSFTAVMFDCDGILVDSEPITNHVLRGMLIDMGWDIGVQECMDRFIGKAFLDEWRVILEHTGHRIDQDWIVEFRRRRDEALRAELQPIPGAADAVRAVAAGLTDRVACVSGADRRKIEMQVRLAGLTEVFADRVFSGMELPRSKPAPDVYLAAATALDVDPATVAVVEDSPTGVRAGVAAGATVFGYAPADRPYAPAEELLDVGASRIFRHMSELPALVLGNGSIAAA